MCVFLAYLQLTSVLMIAILALMVLSILNNRLVWHLFTVLLITVFLSWGKNFIEFSKKERRLSFDERSGVTFVAYFGSQTNIDALDWYIKNVHDQLLGIIPEIELNVIGDRSDRFRDLYRTFKRRKK